MQENSVAKYHALGNDYIVVDPKFLAAEMTEDNIRLLCDRNFGVGSDGILYGPIPTAESASQLFSNQAANNHPGGQTAQKAEDARKHGRQEVERTPSYVMPSDDPQLTPQIGSSGPSGEPYEVRIFNPDGSEAEKSGNGLRIFAKYLFDAGYVGERTQFDVLTKGGLAHIALLHPKAELMEVDMGIPSFQSRDIPVNGEPRDVVAEEISLGGTPFRMTCVSVGNPHCVIVVDRATQALVKTLGPVVEDHALFPNRINLQLVEVLDRHAIRIEIWERGAGYTLASGSSSCAAAAAAHRLGLTDGHVTVMMPGGELDIRIDEGGHIFMRGSAEAVFEAGLSKALLRSLRV